MLRKIFGGSKFLKKMNTLMEVYAVSKNPQTTYAELQTLEKLVRTEGELALYRLNCASLLYDMHRYESAADVIMEIEPINPEFDARCASVKTKIMNAL